MSGVDQVSAILAELAQAEIKLRLIDTGELEVSAPRGRLSADLRDRLVAHKAAIVERLANAARPVQIDKPLPVVVPDPSAADRPFPLSDLQASFLVGSAEGLEYHVRPHQYMEFDVGDLDVERFMWSVNQNLRRHRNDLVVVTDDMRLRRVATFTPLDPTIHDLRGQSPADTDSALMRVRDTMRRRQLPIDRWPWFDIQITLYGEGDARIHYNNNNFFSDGMGTSRFLEDVFGLYRDPEMRQSELVLNFRDCVLALAALEESPLGEQSQRYWRERIPDWPDAPPVPLAPGTQARSRSELSRRELVLPADKWVALKRQARSRGVTDSNVMYAAFAQILSSWSGSRHFLLNNMVTHRLPLHPQIGEVLGNFASLYPLEVDWRADETFEERARRLRSQIQADMQHTYWSGVKVLQAFNQHRRTPGRAACPFVISSGLFMGTLDRPTFSTLETPQVLLDCQFWEQEDGSVWIAWDVIESAFPDGVIDAMHDAFRDLVVALAVDDATWRRERFDLTPPPQLAVRAELNHRPHRPPDGLLHDALAKQALAAPDRLAVRAAGGDLGYGELRRRSDRVAASLRAAGSAPGDLVPVVLPKGWQQCVAVLGVLAADGAYVPVDPDWPSERIGQLLRMTGARHVVTSEALRAAVTGTAEVTVHAVDTDLGEGDAPGGAASSTPVRREPTDLAYVIYTSGSTGTPKGAALDHRGPLNTIVDINERFEVGPDDLVFGISSLCFDLSVYDVFGSVHAGATLVLPDPSELDNPSAWVATVRSAGVTVWNSVPALMQLAVEEAEATGVDLPSLRLVLLSGDWIPVDLADRIRSVAPRAQVIGMGGATEASIWSIIYPIDQIDPLWSSIPYGRPLSGQTWHVFDDAGLDAPDWVPGHLHIGGVGLAVGYWNDPQRTDAAFVAHPRTGERLYRTGDLGRYLPDGTIEFLGRADFQVKIQGYRVELGEIEHVLTRHPAISRALATVRDTAAGRQLVAFAVASSDVDSQVLRSFVGEHLPSYMVPATVILVDRLPLTSNGKVDRRALEALAPAEPERTYVAPRNPIEATVTTIWEEVLEISPIGVYDDFFELGGQSFAGLRMISQINRQVGQRLSMGTLLSQRTVAALCEVLAAPPEWSPLVPLRTAPSQVIGFLVHPAGGSVLCYQSLAERVEANWYALQAPGPDNGQDIPTEVADFAERYVEEIRRVQAHGPYVLGGWSSGAVIAAEIAHQLEAAGEQVARLFVLDSPAPQPASVVDPVSMLLWFLEDLDVGFLAGAVNADERAGLLALDESRRLRAGLSLVRRHTEAATDLDEVALDNTLAVFTGVVQACRRHKPAVIAADIVVIRATEDRVTEYADHPHRGDDDWGWHVVTTGTVTGVRVPGSHLTLLAAQHVAEVAEVIRGHLPDAGGDSPATVRP